VLVLGKDDDTYDVVTLANEGCPTPVRLDVDDGVGVLTFSGSQGEPGLPGCPLVGR
jgi:hypothetical protein